MTKASYSARLALAFAAGLGLSTVSSHAQSATATITDMQVGANWDYTITLDNTGSTSLESFWYGWTQNGNNLPSDPSSAANSLGWDNDLDGNSIQFVGSSADALASGHSATFSFVSSSSPTAITAGASGESVAYVGGIDFSQGTAGDSTAEFSPVLEAPEPSPVALLAAGAGMMAFALRRQFTRRQAAN